MFLLLEVVDASHKGVATYGRGAEHSSFGSHGLTVAHKHGGVIHKRVGLFGRHLQLVGFELVVDVALGGDEHLTLGAEILHQTAFVLDGKSHHPDIVVGFEGVEPEYEVRIALFYSCISKDAGVGSETVGVQVGKLVVRVNVYLVFRFARGVGGAEDGIGKGVAELDKERFHFVIVVVEDDAFHPAQLADMRNVDRRTQTYFDFVFRYQFSDSPIINKLVETFLAQGVVFFANVYVWYAVKVEQLLS